MKAANLDWDATAIMGNKRSKRFVAVVDVYYPFEKNFAYFFRMARSRLSSLSPIMQG